MPEDRVPITLEDIRFLNRSCPEIFVQVAEGRSRTTLEIVKREPGKLEGFNWGECEVSFHGCCGQDPLVRPGNYLIAFGGYTIGRGSFGFKGYASAYDLATDTAIPLEREMFLFFRDIPREKIRRTISTIGE